MAGKALDLRLTGGEKILELARGWTEIGDKGLGRRMDAGLRKAALPIQDAVREEIVTTMPGRGGLAETLSLATKARLQSRRTKLTARVSVRVFADGKAELRDLPRINAGKLRHPVFGRYRYVRGRGKIENPWVTQHVKAGVVDRPFDATAPRVQAEMIKVLEKTAADLAAGRSSE